MDFLALVRERVSSVWCLSNDVSRWSAKLRQWHGIEAYFDGFVISADIGIRKPDARAFEVFVHRCGVRAEDIVFVDDRVRNLDAARGQGLSTVLFSPGHLREVARHRVVGGYAELGGYLFDEDGL